MKINKGYIVVGLIIAFGLIFELAAYADAWDETTAITFSEPIEIPGQVLPAGSYLFKLVDTDAGRDIVQVFSSDRTFLYGTFLTVATDRPEPTGDTTITLAELGAGTPDVLLKWFYPGNSIGHEFLFPKQKEEELAQDTQRTIVANQHANASSENSRAGN
jgi:hypothetical protein